jgi:enoyl-CoA hydratase/carnithine racemase
MAYEVIVYDKPAYGIARITLNRPEARNALSLRMIDEIYEAADEAAKDFEVAVLIYRGNGSSFCAGRDFKERAAIRAETGMDIAREIPGRGHGFMGFGDQTWLHPKCTIAQVQGYAVGGGDLLASGCDITIASEDAHFGFPEIRYGGLTKQWYWNWLIGPKKTKEYMLTGRNMTADEAEKIGLINHVVPAAELEDFVMALATDMANLDKNHPGIIRANKAEINSSHPELFRVLDPRNLSKSHFEALFTASIAADRAAFDEVVAKDGVRAAVAGMHEGFAADR